MACIDKCLKYLNSYVYTYVGIHGYGFVYAGFCVANLFVTLGTTVIRNDLIVGLVIYLGKGAIALCLMCVGVLVALNGPDTWTKGIPHAELFIGVICLLVGYAMGSIAMNILDGTYKAVFICYIENPHALEASHPDEYEQICDAGEDIGLGPREKVCSTRRPVAHAPLTPPPPPHSPTPSLQDLDAEMYGGGEEEVEAADGDEAAEAEGAGSD